jgi:AhpD family alkylhydroperoxidase
MELGRLDRHRADRYRRGRILSGLQRVRPLVVFSACRQALSRRQAVNNEDEGQGRAMKTWPDELAERTAALRNLRTGAPEAMKAFAAIAQSALAPKALDRKTKELIAVGISVAARCDDCIGFHVKAAVEQGATLEEINETLAMAIYMGAGPSVMYATHALDAYAQFTGRSAKPA